MTSYPAFRFGPYRLEPKAGLLWRDGEMLVVAPRVFSLLCLLVERHGEIVAKSELLHLVWGDLFVEESNLTQTVFLLRKLLGRDDAGRDYVQTVARRGYRFAAEVETVAEPGDASAHEPLEFAGPILGSVAPAVVAEAPVTITPANERAVRDDEKTDRPAERPRLHRRAAWWLAAAAALVLGALLMDVTLGRRPPGRPMVLHYTRLTNDGYNKVTSSQLVHNRNRVLLTEIVDGHTALAQVGDDASVQRRVLPVARESVFSAFGNRLLLGNNWDDDGDSPLLVSSPDGMPQPLDGLVAHGAAWSPDGRTIAAVRGHDLVLVTPAGAPVRVLSHLEAVPFWPRWSPDGRRIRFSTMDGGRSRGIYEIAVNAGPSEPQPIYIKEPFRSGSCCGDWTPDGSRYVLVVGGPRRSSLWVSRESGAPGTRPEEPQLLTDGPMDTWRAPLVAADGRHIYAIGEHRRGELVRWDPGSRSFRPWLNALSADTPSVSPDGQSVAYTAYPEGTLWRSRMDGSGRQQLTGDGQLSRFPQWSPDGRWLSFIASSGSGPWQVYVVPSAGGQPRPVLPSASSQGVATWSPDGKRLAFGSIVSYGVGRKDSARLTVLDLERNAPTEVPGSEGLWMARWSPDGRYLAAADLARNTLKLFDFHTAAWQKLASMSVNDLCWARGSPHTLFVDSPNAGDPAIFRIDVDQRLTARYASLAGVQRTGFEGWRFSLAADDTPVLLREAGTQELYSLEVQLQ